MRLEVGYASDVSTSELKVPKPSKKPEKKTIQTKLQTLVLSESENKKDGILDWGAGVDTGEIPPTSSASVNSAKFWWSENVNTDRSYDRLQQLLVSRSPCTLYAN